MLNISAILQRAKGLTAKEKEEKGDAFLGLPVS